MATKTVVWLRHAERAVYRPEVVADCARWIRFDKEWFLVGINNAGPWLVRPDLLPALKAVHNSGAGVVAGVDVVGVLRDILEDMTGKSLSGIAYAIHGDAVRQAVARMSATGAVNADPAF